ncbi:hypothetical protein AABC73_01405 [Pseudomonas sp. G.S.17]|uniref:hypothetical protein n=1 Tax=Pseudomonas sp. G.S.17 TaxID=3137451 RepID=UPI00311CB146
MNNLVNESTVKWSRLGHFSVESTTGNTQLYANGRQQVELLVKIQVVDDNGTSVPLSDAEASSLQLIQYDDNSVVEREIFSREPLPSNTWRWSYDYNQDYSFLPGTSSFADQSPSNSKATLQTLSTVYLRTTSLRPLKFALQITREDGQVFRSINPDLEKGFMTVTPLPARQYKPSDYLFKPIPIVVPGNPDSPAAHDGHDFYPLELYEGGEQVQFTRYSLKVSQENIFRFDIAPRTRGSYTSLTAPGDRYLKYSNYNLNNPLLEIGGSYVKDGTIVVALIHRNIVMLSGGAPNNDEVMSFSVVDIYGNDHNFRIRFQGTGRKLLELF